MSWSILVFLNQVFASCALSVKNFGGLYLVECEVSFMFFLILVYCGSCYKNSFYFNKLLHVLNTGVGYRLTVNQFCLRLFHF
jgi:hypothetical protein